MIRNFTLTNALGASFSLMNAQQGAFFEPQGLGFNDATQYEQVGEFFAPLTQRYGQQVVTGSMVFGSQPYENYLTFTKFCQHAPLSLVYETDAGTFQIPCRLTKIEKGDTDGWTYLECKVEFTALARMYKTVTANNTGTAGGGKVYLAKDLPDITGSIITIDNAEVGEVLNITADINPVQSGSGTPSPQNIRPISGRSSVDVVRAGKNLLNANMTPFVTTGTTLTVSGDRITVEADGTSTYQSGMYGNSSNLIFPAGTYYVKCNVISIQNALLSIRLGFRNASNNFVAPNISLTSTGNKSATVTLTEACYFSITVTWGTTGTANKVVIDNLMISATDVPYEPYNGNTYTTALGRTVYGGTLDLVSGVLTVDRIAYTVGGLSWDYDSAGTRFITKTSVDLSQLKAPTSSAIPAENSLSSAYELVSQNVFSGGTIPNGVYMLSTGKRISVRDTRYTTVSDFTTNMGSAQLVFGLATPQTYQLTPQQIQTLLGTNNVWANSGDITITGRKTYGYEYNYTYGDFVADTVTIDSDSVTASPCRISIFGECTQPTWRHYLDGNSVATGYYNGTIPSGHKLVIDTTSSPYSIEEQDISGNLIADRYELCDFSTERFFLLEYGHNTISVSHTDPDSIRLMVEGYIFYETV